MAKTTITTTNAATVAAPKKILENKTITSKFRGFSNKALKDGKKKFILRFSIPGQE